MNLLPEMSFNEQQEMSNTFLGQMPSQENLKKYLMSPEITEHLINAGGGGEFRLLGQEIAKGLPIAKKAGEKAIEYINPKKIAEETERFRAGISGAGSESENIAQLSSRTQFAKKSGEEEALAPKREIYSQEGKSNVYEIGKENLPEGNLPSMAHMIEPGAQFTEAQQKALSTALKNYRKNGNIDSFIEHSEDIFGVPGLSKKAESKLEDALLIPTKRESNYLSDGDVASYYGKSGKIKKAHDDYSKKPTLNNYDALQHLLKKEERKLSKMEKKGTIGDVAQSKLDQLRLNISNLDEDVTQFVKTLPEKMQNLEKEFRTKWATGPAKYADAELTLRRLSSGKPGVLNKVTNNDIVKTFTRPDEKTLAALKEMGPSVGGHVIYSALSKIKQGQGKEMAETLLDLSKKPGFEGFITPMMKEWAENMISRSSRSETAMRGMQATGGGLTGAALGSMLGPFGAAAGGLLGAGSPYLVQALKSMSKNYKK